MQGEKQKQLYWVTYIALVINSPEIDHFLHLQIGNIKPETEIIWSKDCIEIAEDDEDAEKIEKKDSELTFNIGKVSLLERGCILWEAGCLEVRRHFIGQI